LSIRLPFMSVITLSGAMTWLFFLPAGLVGTLPGRAQDTATQPQTTTAEPQDGVAPASNVDDPYGANALVTPETSFGEASAEPSNSTTTPSDGSTASSDSGAALSENTSPERNLMPFEEFTTEPFSDTMEARREQAEDLPEESDVPDLVTPGELLPALSIIPAFHLGSMTLAFGARYEATYDDNILLSATDPQGDFEHILSPRLSLSLGDSVTQKSNFLALEYDPQIILFQHYNQYDALDQELQLNGQYMLTRTIVRESLDYNHSTDPDRELQGRVSRDVISSETNATYQASDRFAYELDGTALIRNFQQEIDSDEGRLRFWTRYTASPDWTVSVGAAGGALLPEEGASQIFAQGWLATQAQIGPAVSLNLAVGGDFREPQNTGEVLSTPVFDATFRFEPSTETQVEISAIRQIFSSPDEIDENYISTKVSIKATQRLWQTYKVGIEAGYENADYYQFGTGAAGVRADNFPYAKVEVGYARFEDLEVSVYYLAQRNFSSQPDLSFSDQQAGIQFRIGY
jgi:hypothetical protein